MVFEVFDKLEIEIFEAGEDQSRFANSSELFNMLFVEDLKYSKGKKVFSSNSTFSPGGVFKDILIFSVRKNCLQYDYLFKLNECDELITFYPH